MPLPGWVKAFFVSFSGLSFWRWRQLPRTFDFIACQRGLVYWAKTSTRWYLQMRQAVKMEEIRWACTRSETKTSPRSLRQEQLVTIGIVYEIDDLLLLIYYNI